MITDDEQRDMFADSAMCEILKQTNARGLSDSKIKTLARISYQIADAMMERKEMPNAVAEESEDR